ncbi:DUF6113 family protein [Streptomyces sp. TRM70308]|uniref:DUF6113 family protein n=1 Tax=Streptomyces sp. TRM70308 TaxID=3131932 RepID=UPI003CFC7963
MSAVRSAGRLALYAGLAVLAAAAGLAGVLVHTLWAPGGVLLALAGTAAVCVGGSLLTGRRAGAAVPAVVWTLTVLPLALWRLPEGDLLVAGDAVSSYVYLYGGLALAVVCATVQPPPPPRSRGPEDLTGRPQ